MSFAMHSIFIANLIKGMLMKYSKFIKIAWVNMQITFMTKRILTLKTDVMAVLYQLILSKLFMIDLQRILAAHFILIGIKFHCSC